MCTGRWFSDVDASQALVALDRSLARAGRDIVLQRMNGAAVAAQVTCRAVVRGYTPRELVGITADSMVILSPSRSSRRAGKPSL